MISQEECRVVLQTALFAVKGDTNPTLRTPQTCWWSFVDFNNCYMENGWLFCHMQMQKSREHVQAIISTDKSYLQLDRSYHLLFYPTALKFCILENSVFHVQICLISRKLTIFSTDSTWLRAVTRCQSKYRIDQRQFFNHDSLGFFCVRSLLSSWLDVQF